MKLFKIITGILLMLGIPTMMAMLFFKVGVQYSSGSGDTIGLMGICILIWTAILIITCYLGIIGTLNKYINED